MTILMNCPFCSTNGFTHAKLAQHLFECDEFNSHRRALRENSATQVPVSREAQEGVPLTTGGDASPASAEPTGAVEEKPVAWIWHYRTGQRSLRWEEDQRDWKNGDVPDSSSPLYSKDTIDSLQSRLRDAKQRAEKAEHELRLAFNSNLVLKAGIEQEAEIEKLKRDGEDARRYRYLRDEGAGHLHVYRGTEEHSLLPEELEQAIDEGIDAIQRAGE